MRRSNCAMQHWADRGRWKGGGRRPLVVTDPTLLTDLRDLVGKHARRTAGLLRARVSSDSYDARRVRQLVRKQMLRFAASTPMGGVRAGGFAGLKRCG
jgi:hypothetical protein